MNSTEHLLVCLNEEGVESALEMAKIADKALRFGLDDQNVLNPTGPTNRERLIDELNDLMGVIGLMVEHGILPAGWKDASKIDAKKDKVRKFMAYAAEKGALQ